MPNSKHRHIFIAVVSFIVLSVIGLWSFNTVTELFSGPTAQYKHVLAVLSLLITLRWLWRPTHLQRAINDFRGGARER